VAPSGSGKTTVVNLLERFWDYDEGNIYINKTNLKELKLSALRNYISLVSQDIYLFNMSIMDNLRLAKEDATKEEIERACAEANALDFIKELPEGLGTVVGERGTRLSGGQKQRIAIAQALLRDTPIIIFDEATSNLDVKKELGILETLRKIKKNKVILVVAHRQATIDAADRIVNLEKAV
jgi:ABC-type multidrug transport system fused ATPase/permease subunit